MPDDLFGPLVSGADVERWALDTLKLWAPTYLAWVERRTGRRPRSIPTPKTWITTTEVEGWPEDRLPAVLLLSTGLADEPTRDGRGRYSAPFALGLAVVVSDRDRESAEQLAKLYAAALRVLLVQNGSLGGHATATDWLDERYDAVPGTRRSRQQLAAGQLVFRVEVSNVAAKRGGPSAPPDDPYEPLPNDPPFTRAEVEVHAAPLLEAP